MVKTPQERLDYINKWRKEHPDLVAKSRKRYKKNHAEHIREKERERYPRIKDEKNRKKREKRRADPSFSGRVWVWTRDEIAKNPESYKDYKKSLASRCYNQTRTETLLKMHQRIVNRRIEVLYVYSNGEMRCAKCGEQNLEFLAIDHINNDGHLDRKNYKGNVINYLISREFPEGYQVLCHNCNAVKHVNTLTRSDPSAAYNKFRDKRKREMVKRYSNETSKCVCCGESDMRCLTFHHVNGGGTAHMRTLKDKSLAAFLWKNKPPTEEFRVLCFNCNSSLGHYGYCPHEKKENDSPSC